MIPILVPVVLGGGRGPSLDLRFAEWQSLGGLVTFTRSSSATYRDSSGARQTAGSNVARFDHTAAGVPLGLLIEEGRTNILLNSATLSTQSVSVTAQAYTLSFEGTGTVTLSGASTAGPLVGTGATNRVSLTFTPSAGTLTLTVSGTVEAANLEAGSFGTSWIPTTGSTATRSADVVSLAVGLWYNSTAGTFAFDYRPPTNGLSAPARRQIARSNSGGNNRLDIRSADTTAAANLPLVAYGTGGTVASLSPVAEQNALALNKAAWAYGSDGAALSVNGAAAVTSASGFADGGLLTTLYLGQSEANTGVNNLCGHLSRLRYFGSRLSNGSLAALTT